MRLTNKMRLQSMVRLALKDNLSYQGISVRDSDIALTIMLWVRYFSVSDKPDGTIHVRRLFDLPREDNVKRVRAQIQNVEHLYLPTSWAVAKKRGFEREAWERYLGYKMTGDEMARHKQTVKETTPPKFEQETLMDVPKKQKRWL